ncbi:MAG: hypothetical protein CMF46_05325 [Legionellales bacterium]|nr:hypothetical protein [Legionellales bacterium]|tara:strand:+ start:2591 stop:3502 length:912 start_codon:yes stop_codon:yes gene_type:complete
MQYSKSYHGKWILCGEHSVTRGKSAITIPFNQKKCQFYYHKNASDLTVDYRGVDATEMGQQLNKMVDKTLEALGHNKQTVSGELTIDNDIPIGVGFGFSAVWSVGFAELFIELGLLESTDIQSVAHQIENLFHNNNSSGLDVAGVLSPSALHYSPGQRNQPFESTWTPHIYIQDISQKSLTEIAIQHVQKVRQENPAKSAYIDDTMQKSVDLAIIGLQLEDHKEALILLKESMRLSNECYEEWGLITPDTRKAMNHLRTLGALTTRVSGKGLGGIIIGLWPHKLDQQTIDKHKLYHGFNFSGG